MATTINIIGPSASVTPTAEQSISGVAYQATVVWDSANSQWVATFSDTPVGIPGNIVITATGFEDYIIQPSDIEETMTITMIAVTQTVANLSDGTNTYEIEDSQARADIQEIQNNYVTMATLEAIYPVGSVYIGTQATCPMSTVMSGTTWTLVSSGKALWTGDGTNGDTTIAAGLPNITGGITSCANQFKGNTNPTASGALSITTTGVNYVNYGAEVGTAITGINFKASDSNSIYGASNTVQPPAYVVNVWRRTA